MYLEPYTVYVPTYTLYLYFARALHMYLSLYSICSHKYCSVYARAVYMYLPYSPVYQRLWIMFPVSNYRL
jgi:hypothetical protein